MEIKTLASTIMMISCLVIPFAVIASVFTAIIHLGKDKDNSQQLANNLSSTILTFFLASNRGKNIDPNIFTKQNKSNNNQQDNGFVDYSSNNDFYNPTDTNTNANASKKPKLVLNNSIRYKKSNINRLLLGFCIATIMFLSLTVAYLLSL